MHFRILCCLTALACCTTLAADVTFVRVWPSWRDAASFDRITEYFGQPEPTTGRETILRTQAAERDGYYFLVRVKSGAAIAGAKFELSVIRPDTPDTKVYTFPLGGALPARETVYQLGVTGSDWPAGRKANPVAWKIAVIGGDGQLLVEHKSFLWEKPAK